MLPVATRFAAGPLGADATGVGLSIGAFSIAALALRPVVGWASDRSGVGPLLLPAARHRRRLVAHLAATTLPEFVVVRGRCSASGRRSSSSPASRPSATRATPNGAARRSTSGRLPSTSGWPRPVHRRDARWRGRLRRRLDRVGRVRGRRGDCDAPSRATRPRACSPPGPDHDRVGTLSPPGRRQARGTPGPHRRLGDGGVLRDRRPCGDAWGSRWPGAPGASRARRRGPADRFVYAVRTGWGRPACLARRLPVTAIGRRLRALPGEVGLRVGTAIVRSSSRSCTRRW